MSDTATSLTVNIPMVPHPSLSPNARVHWRTRHRHAKEARSAAYYCMCNANVELWEPVLPLTLHVVVTWPNRRYLRDDDNLWQGVKPFRDGIADALGIDDSNIVAGTTVQAVDAANVGIEVRIEEAGS